MILKNGAISICYPSGSSAKVARIELRDSDSSTLFAIATLNEHQLMDAMSGLGHTPCKIEVMGFHKVGKKMEHKTVALEIGKVSLGDDRKELATDVFNKHYKGSEWIPDFYFSSQNSFYDERGITFARCIVRRWVDITERE